MLFHDSRGGTGMKNLYCANFPCTPPVIAPGVRCAVFTGCAVPAGFLGFAVDFEADSKWDSQWDGLLVTFNKRMTKHVGWGLSYTWSKGIDNGPNPSFVLIPQDSTSFDRERALSADHVAHRFVGNATLAGPTHMNALMNDWQLGMIVSCRRLITSLNLPGLIRTVTSLGTMTALASKVATHSAEIPSKASIYGCHEHLRCTRE